MCWRAPSEPRRTGDDGALGRRPARPAWRRLSHPRPGSALRAASRCRPSLQPDEAVGGEQDAFDDGLPCGAWRRRRRGRRASWPGSTLHGGPGKPGRSGAQAAGADLADSPRPTATDVPSATGPPASDRRCPRIRWLPAPPDSTRLRGIGSLVATPTPSSNACFGGRRAGSRKRTRRQRCITQGPIV